VNAKKVARQWFDKILTMGNRYLPLWDGAMLSILPMAALALRLGWPGRWLEHWPHLGWAFSTGWDCTGAAGVMPAWATWSR
jgi:hypothetical protein